jgi:uncharacterized protein with HEPN domain
VSFDRRAALLADIITNGERIAAYVNGLDLPTFRQDSRTNDAVERCLERICEAAIRLGDDAEDLMPGQPWREIRGTGNWLRHAYHKIEESLVWDTVERDVPGLVEAARAAYEHLSQ